MIVYIDANIVIYLVEQVPVFGPKAAARIAQFQAQNGEIVTSDASRLECRVGPLKVGDASKLADFDSYFASVRVLALTAAVCDRASELRANYSFKPLDSLHLAAAIVHGCDVFLTNDTRLNRCH